MNWGLAFLGNKSNEYKILGNKTAVGQCSWYEQIETTIQEH